MQYSVRNRRKLRQTGEIGIPRTMTVRGTGVADVATPVLEGSGRPSETPVNEITPVQVTKNNGR